jgi:hypothetical protein
MVGRDCGAARIAPSCTSGISATPEVFQVGVFALHHRPRIQGWPKFQACPLLTRQHAATPLRLDARDASQSLHWEDQPVPCRGFFEPHHGNGPAWGAEAVGPSGFAVLDKRGGLGTRTQPNITSTGGGILERGDRSNRWLR